MFALTLATLTALTLPPPAPAADPEARPPAPGASAETTSSTAAPAPDRRAFNLTRAGLEIGGAMVAGVVWYQSQIELNKLDFDFDRTLGDQWRRLSTSAGYRFDDNNLTLNVGHAFMGTYYHQFARSNGGGMLEALAFDFVTSSTWEFLVEHREVVSLNDTVTTTFGGVALGESLFQLGEFFARSRPTVVNRVLMGVFSPARAMAWLTGDAPEMSAAGFDDAGLAADAAHRFALSLGALQQVATETPPLQSNARLDLELVSLPLYGRPGRAAGWLRGGEFTRIEFAYASGRERAQHISLSTRASLWGHQRQDLRPGVTGPVGFSRFIGTATALDVSADDLGSTSDFITSVHIIGPSFDAAAFKGRFALRLGADAYPDFAMVRSFAIGDAASRPHPGMKTTLQDNYYYAGGVTGRARIEASYRRFRTGVALGASHFDSIEGLDRHQNAYTSPTGVFHPAISDDRNITDQRLSMRLFSETPLPLTDMLLGLSLDVQRRQGQLGQARRKADDVRWGVHARYAM